MTRHNGVRRTLLLAVTLMFVLVACAEDDGGGNEVDTTEAGTATTAEGEGESAQPAEGGRTLVYAVPAVGDLLDSATFQGDPGRWTLWNQMSSLVRYDVTGLEGDGCGELASVDQLQGELAESWEFDEAESAWIVTLREAQSPAGNTLTAEDVKWSYDRMNELSGVSRFMYQGQASYADNAVEVVDERTVKINVGNQTALDMAIHTIGPFTMGIFDSTEAKEHATADDPWAVGWLTENTANFGPWQVDSFTPGEEVVYVPNENYWGERGNVEQFVIRAIPESQTRTQLIRAGEVDVTTRLSFEETQSLQDVDGLRVDDCVSPNRDTIVMNLNQAPFDDARVRAALSLAIDRQALVDGPYRGFAEPAQHALPDGYGSPASAPAFEQDLDRARELLAEAGYEDGLDATLTLSPSRPGPHAEQVAILIQDMAAQVGINFQLEVIASASDFNTRYNEAEFEAMLYLDPPAVADAAYTLNNYLHTDAAQNSFGYSNVDLDALIEQIGQTPPGPERDPILEEADRLIKDDMPIVYLVNRSYIDVFQEGITGVPHLPHGELLAAFLTKS